MDELSAPLSVGPEIAGLVQDHRTYTLPGILETQAMIHLYEYKESESEELCWRISKLWVAPEARRQGLAKRLLQAVTDQADKQSIMLTLVAEPERRAITLRELKRFYSRHGFIQLYDGFMKRTPRSEG